MGIAMEEFHLVHHARYAQRILRRRRTVTDFLRTAAVALGM